MILASNERGEKKQRCLLRKIKEKVASPRPLWITYYLWSEAKNSDFPKPRVPIKARKKYDNPLKS